MRWGEAPGRLTEQTEQDHKLVYEYVYGPGECGLAGELVDLCLPGDLVVWHRGMRFGIALQQGQQQQQLRHAAGAPRRSANPAVPAASLLRSAEQGDTTYQSPILHHVLLRDLKPGATIHYSVGERRWC